MFKFAPSVRVSIVALGAGTMWVGTAVEALAASGSPANTVPQHPEINRYPTDISTETAFTIAQVRVQTDRPLVPSQVDVGPVRISNPGQTNTQPTAQQTAQPTAQPAQPATAGGPVTPAPQPVAPQNPAIAPAPVPGVPGAPVQQVPQAVPNAPFFAPNGFGAPFNAGAQVITPYPTILNLQPQSAISPVGGATNSPAPVQLVCNPGPYVAYAQAQNAVLATQLLAAQQQAQTAQVAQAVQAAQANESRRGRGNSTGNILLGALTPTIDVDLGGTELGIPLPIPALISSLVSGGSGSEEEEATAAALTAQQQLAQQQVAQQQALGQQLLGGPVAPQPGFPGGVPGQGAPTIASTQVFTSYPAVINVAVPDALLEEAQNPQAAAAQANGPDLGGIQLVCGGAAPLIPQSALTPAIAPQGHLAPTAPAPTLPAGQVQQSPGALAPNAPVPTLPAGNVANPAPAPQGTVAPTAPAPTQPTGNVGPSSGALEAEVGPVRLSVPQGN